jgi:hypothetical protein
MMATSSRSGAQEAASQDATCTACETVFGTAELVEQILVHLPAKQLFTSQRVCKTFANAIAASPAIQVKLFKRLPSHPKTQTPGSTNPSAKGKRPAQPEAPGDRELAATVPLHSILSPWLVVIPRRRRCTRGMPAPQYVKVQFKWRRSARAYFITTNEDSYLDTYFCDPPCRTITVHQRYLVDGDGFENTQDMQTDRPMTVREVLEKALDQTGSVTDSFSDMPGIPCTNMRAVVKSHEQVKGCTDGSKTVLSKAEFTLHGVVKPVILKDETEGPNEMAFIHRLPNRKVASSRARAKMAM